MIFIDSEYLARKTNLASTPAKRRIVEMVWEDWKWATTPKFRV